MLDFSLTGIEGDLSTITEAILAYSGEGCEMPFMPGHLTIRSLWSFLKSLQVMKK